MMATRRLGGRRAHGAPVYTYQRIPGVPPVSVIRFDGTGPAVGDPARDHAHAHDFLVLAYFERSGGALRIDQRSWPIATGDAYVIAPGEVVALPDENGLHHARGWTALFAPDALGLQASGALLSWGTHPLLFPFARGAARGAQRLHVPPADRRAWSERFAALDEELTTRRDGYHDAVMAHLTLLLVATSRLVVDVAGALKLTGEPLLAEVFAIIEKRFANPLSLKDVAAAVHLSPAHLTTVVGRRTGRTVQQWIAERRMAEARRMLVDTDLTMQEVGTRSGYPDAGYFARVFRRNHAASPLAWRRANRATPANDPSTASSPTSTGLGIELSRPGSSTADASTLAAHDGADRAGAGDQPAPT